MLSLLPMLGALMTLFSFLMMQFPIYEEWGVCSGETGGLLPVSEYICAVHACLPDHRSMED